ncbi:MAG: energy transducer TonB [Candidatus Ratteibacteria bacterium]|jgi:TonB family protein
MKAYLLSVFFHLLFAGLLFFLAVSPGKALPSGRVDQVFLVTSIPVAPISSVSADALPATPSGSMSRVPAIKPENTIEPVPVKPEKSLAEKLAMRLNGATSEVWNHTTANRSGEPREQSGTAAETGTGVPVKEGLSPGQTQSLPSQASVSTGEGATRVKPEEGFSDEWYLTLLSRRLTERWNPVREGIAVVAREVTVSFTITRDGRIKDVGLTRASGNQRFDRSGVTAVVESDFLPPLPTSWGKKELQISVRFREK